MQSRILSLILAGFSGLFCFWSLLRSERLYAETIDLPYSGRIVEADGTPVIGPIDLLVEFFRTETSNTTLGEPVAYRNIGLVNGVFQVTIALPAATYNQIFSSIEQQVWIQVTDQTNDNKYPRQLLGATPYALKIPIDGTTLGWNNDGRLEILGEASVNRVGGEKFETKEANNGQVLTWDSTKKTWKPATIPAGSLTSITAGSGLSGGTITATGTIAVATGGVATAMIADGAVTTSKLATGAVNTGAVVDEAITTAKIKDATIGPSDLNVGPCSSGQVLQFNATQGSFDCGTMGSGSGSGDISNNGNAGVITLGSNDSSLTLKSLYGPVVTVATSGRVGVKTVNPTAQLELPAGTAAANTAPLKLSAGTNLTTPEAGAIEYNGADLFYTNGSAARQKVASYNSSLTPTSGQILSWNGTAWVPAAAGGIGTVTSITAGTGLSGGAITSSGTVALANTTVTPGSYVRADITVDAQGRLTAAASGANVNVASEVTGTLATTNGGTGVTTLGTNAVLTSNGSGALTAQSGTSSQVMIGNAVGAPSFGQISDSQISTSAAIARSKIATGTVSQVVVNDGSGNLSSEAQLSVSRGGTGAATAGSNLFFGGPTSGGPLAPAFRGLAASDIPDPAGDISGTYGASTVAKIQGVAVSATIPTTGQVLSYNGTNWVPTADGFSGSLAGDITGTQGATAISAGTVTGKALTGYVSGAGTVAATDSILGAINKLDGNDALKAPVASPTFTGTLGVGLAQLSNVFGSQLSITGYGLLFNNPTTDFLIESTPPVGFRTRIPMGNRAWAFQNTGNASLSVESSIATTIPFFLKGAASQSADLFQIRSNGSSTGDLYTINSLGNIGIGTTAPTAVLQLKAGAAAAGSAPVKLTSGTNLTTAEAGAIEYNGTDLFYTNGTAVRQKIAGYDNSLTPTSGQVLSWNGTAWAPASAGGVGTVTSITAGTGLSGGAITSSGTINLANTAVTPAAYTRANITVDAQGRITAAANGGAVSLTADVTGTLPAANGGTGAASLGTNAVLTSNGSGALSAQSGTTSQVLIGSAVTNPSFGQISDAQIAAAAGIARTKVAIGTINHVLINDGSGNLSSEAQLGVSRGGTGAATAANNLVFAGPTTGGPSAPAFRSLAASDLPAPGGDLSGSFATATVAKIQGVAVSATTPTTGQVLSYNGTNWVPTADGFSGSLAGDVTGTQGATAISAGTVTGKVLTGYVSGAGAVAATDSILGAINKLNGNDALKAPIASPTFSGTVTAPAFSGPLTGNVTGSADSFTGSLVGDVTGTQGATAISASTVTGKTLTGYVSGSGAVAATDSILGAINKLNGNDALKAPIASPTFTGTVTAPIINGGSATTAALTYKTTTGVGTTGADHIFQVGNNGATEAMRILNNGNVGVGTTAPTASLQLKAGTASAGTAPLKLTSGINLTTAEAGALEYNGTDFFYTNGAAARQKIAGYDNSLTPISGQVLSWNGTAWAPASAGGAGTVTSITAGTGLSGGAITSSGTIDLANTAVTPAAYTRANITVDAQGRITAAASGGAVSLTADVTGTLPAANGGTGATSLGTNAVLTSNGSGALSAQSGTTSQVLIGSAVTNPSFGQINDAQIAAAAGIARTKVATGTVNHVLINDGSGNLSSEAQLAVSRGGTGAATAANNLVFAGPTTGGPSAPAFRGLAASDLPAPGGDLSGSFATATVAKIQGVAVSATTPTTGQVLSYNGTNWVPTADGFSGSLAGDVTGTQGATAISAGTVTGKALTGYVSGAGTVAATDSILAAIQKLNGNDALNAPVASPIFTGTLTTPILMGGTGTTSSITYKTTSGVGATGADHIFKVGTNGTTEAMRILNNGRVGIGTTVPAGTFDVRGGTATGAVAGTNINIVAQNGGPTGANGGDIYLTPGAPGGSWVDSGAVIVQVNGSGVRALEVARNATDAYVSTSASTYSPPFTTILSNSWQFNNNTALLGFGLKNLSNVDQNAFFGAISVAGAGSSPALVWGQTTGASAYSERMRIDSTGFVGIGTSAPASLLNVVAAPVASANYGLFSLGNGAWNGSTAGFFVGSASGTELAVNAASGYAGNLIDLQLAGASKFSISSNGTLFSALNANIAGTVSASAFSANQSNSNLYAATGSSALPNGTVNFTTINSSSTDSTLSSVILQSRNASGLDQKAYIGALSTTGASTYAPSIVFGYRTGLTAYAERMRIDPAGNIGLNTAAPVSLLNVVAAPTASANYGLFSLGNGPWDGSTAGFFAGSASGTEHAINAATGYTGSLADYQVGGVSKFKVDASGNLTIAGTLSGTISNANVSWAAPNAIGTTTPAAGTFTALASTGYTQTSGNLAMSGTGTFSTGTGTVSLNGPTTLAANQNLSLASGTGTIGQTYTGTGSAATLTANSLTSGNILSLTSSSTAAAAGNAGLNIGISGANATSAMTRYGMKSVLTSTGTASTNVAGYFSATSATNNYGLIVENGYVGVGTTVPAAKLDVNGDAKINGMVVGLGGGAEVTNSGVGSGVLQANVTDGVNLGVKNSGFGYLSLNSNTSGGRNSGFGYKTLSSTTSGADDTAVGYDALYTNTTGNMNVAIGSTAMYSNVGGSSDTAVGGLALYTNANGVSNTAIGYKALTNATLGSYNTAVGTKAGQDITGSSDATGANTFVGYLAGAGITTGTNNTIIGANIAALPVATSNNIVIADGSGNRRINVDSTGNVGIGTTTPSYKLDVNGDISIDTGNRMRFFRPNGTEDLQIISGTANSFLQTQVGGLHLDAVGDVSFSSASGVSAYYDYNTPYTQRFSILTNIAGTAAAPTFYLDADANTGMFHPAGDTLAITTGGSERLRVGATGNVGIGTTAPGALLDIGLAGTTLGTLRLEGNTSGYVQVQPAAAAGSWTMTLPSVAGTSGYVLSTDGSGVTSWISNAGTASTAFSGVTAAASAQTLAQSNYAQAWNWDTLSTQSALSLGSTSITSGKLFNATSTATAMTGTLGNFALSGNNAANTGTVLKASVTGASSAAVPFMVTNAGTGLSFRVNDDGTDTDSTPVVVDATGKFGIGMAAPAQMLDVAGNINVSSGSSYMYNGTNVITAQPASSNFYFGNAGNLTGSGSYNTAVGNLALSLNTTGFSNSALGNSALKTNAGGYGNTAIGDLALMANTTGYHNTAIGESALTASTSGFSNVAIGNDALTANTIGNENIAIGDLTLSLSTSGTRNVGVGSETLKALTSGIMNIAIGRRAGAAVTTGGYNTLLGENAGNGITTGGTNTLVGSSSGLSITTGSNNVILGSNSGSSIAALSNYIIISDGSGNERMRSDSVGNIGIGTTNPGTTLEVNGLAKVKGVVNGSQSVSLSTVSTFAADGSGVILVTQTAGAPNTILTITGCNSGVVGQGQIVSVVAVGWVAGQTLLSDTAVGSVAADNMVLNGSGVFTLVGSAATRGSSIQLLCTTINAVKAWVEVGRSANTN